MLVTHFLTLLSGFWYVLGALLLTHFYIVSIDFFFDPYILTRLSATQHPQPEDVHPEFPPQVQRFHPYSRDLQQQQEMIAGRPVNPRSAQLGDQLINASGARNPYGIPVTMNQRSLANSARTLSQHGPPYLGSASGPLTGIARLPYFPLAGFAQGSNYIGVLNIKSSTRSQQSKKRKRGGGTSSPRKRKGENNISHKEVY